MSILIIIYILVIVAVTIQILSIIDTILGFPIMDRVYRWFKRR